LVVGSPERRDLPSGLAVVLDVDDRGGGTIIGDYPDGPLGVIEVSGIGEQQAERIAIALGRLGGRAAKAAPSGLVELLGLGTATDPNVLGAWQQPPSDRLTIAVGLMIPERRSPSVSAGRPSRHDRRNDGLREERTAPDDLTALALRHSPDRLALFLVDFKGGSTFAPLASLPHGGSGHRPRA
jgi:S-DNA-T family DNA segregation ATPase FtsK/SpoIIIE